MKRLRFVLRIVAVALLVGSAALLAAVWTPDRPVDSLVARWAAPPSQFLTVDGIAAHVRDVYGEPSRITPELVDRYFELTLREGNRAAIAARFAQEKPGEFAADIAKVKQPTLILWGGKDRLIPVEYAQQFHHDIAGSQLVVFDDLGHVPQEEDPLRTVAAVTAFLDLAGS